MGFEIVDKGHHIAVTLRGFANAEDARAHFRRLATALERQRARLGRARVVVNMTDASPQSGEVTSIMSESTARLYEDNDRVAVHLSSSLLKLQIKRVLADRAFPTFTDDAEALAFALS